MKVDRVFDATGLLCPMPVVKVAKEMKSLEDGQILKLIATDRGSLADVPAWAEDTGNQLLEHSEENGVFTFFVKKGEG
ncbi:MAG: sulfurtransferase TusA family protein [Actinomycetota bacterium]